MHNRILLCDHADVLDNVLAKTSCSSVVELLVGEMEPSIKQSPYLPLDDDEDFITGDPLLDDNFEDDCHSQKEDEIVTNNLEVDKEQENNITVESKPLFQLGILKYIFSVFKTSLTKDKWLEHPTEQYALVWCLRSLKVIYRIYSNY